MGLKEDVWALLNSYWQSVPRFARSSVRAIFLGVYDITVRTVDFISVQIDSVETSALKIKKWLNAKIDTVGKKLDDTVQYVLDLKADFDTLVNDTINSLKNAVSGLTKRIVDGLKESKEYLIQRLTSLWVDVLAGLDRLSSRLRKKLAEVQVVLLEQLALIETTLRALIVDVTEDLSSLSENLDNPSWLWALIEKTLSGVQLPGGK